MRADRPAFRPASLHARALATCLLAGAVASGATAAIAAGTVCPLVRQAGVAAADAPAAVPEDPTCLVDARKLGKQDVLDLRARGEFLAYHAPGAQHLSR